jgi:hypothetical protein
VVGLPLVGISAVGNDVEEASIVSDDSSVSVTTTLLPIALSGD